VTLITGFEARYCHHYVRKLVLFVFVDRVLRAAPGGRRIGKMPLSRTNEKFRWPVRLRVTTLACCIALGVFPAVALAAKPVVDEPAPDFALKSSTGQNLRLSEYRGDVVLLNFWTRSCSRCRDQLDQLDELYLAHRDDGFTVLSVAITDEPHHVQEIVDSLKLSFPVVYDANKSAARLYDPSSMPLTLLIDPHGRIRYLHKKYRRGDEDTYREQLTALLAE